MIIKIDSTTEFDTDRDFSSAERHILQKLLGWKALVNSIDQFRQKKESAFGVGWNNSGPIRESKTMALVVQHLEKELHLRLKNDEEHKKNVL